jgi:cardiolipin synthase
LHAARVTDIGYYFLRLRADIFVPVGFLLAAFVTMHVLLHKREVASAVGWIALAWFAPITGSVTYLVLGINRVRRRARQIRGRDNDISGATPDGACLATGHLDALERGVGRLTGRELVAGNAVAVFQDGDEAYPAMLAAIQSATRSIAMCSYIFRDDVWGGRFIDALADAQNRGVAVRVLVDGVGSGWLRSPAYHHLRRAGIPAARFLHSVLPWRMPFLNLRSHRKILVIDGVIGFTGGINIADQNVQADHPHAPVRDTHFRIEGPVVRQLSDAFAEDWLFAAGEDLDEAFWQATPPPRGDAPGRVIDSGPDEDIEKIEFAVLQAVACAQNSIRIMTPYFLPDDRLLAALALAAQRGVEVDVVVPEKSDHILIQYAVFANAAPLLTHGVRLWLCPPPFRHSKITTVDDSWCLIGSCNWDIRSFRLNFELCVEFYNEPPFTAADLDRRSRFATLRDAAARLTMPYL